MIVDLLFLNAWEKRRDRDTLARNVLERARRSGLMIAAAESCTGGLVAAALTEIAGSSDVFDRGFVTYSNASKIRQLGVDPRLIDEHGAVSEPVAARLCAPSTSSWSTPAKARSPQSWCPSCLLRALRENYRHLTAFPLCSTVSSGL